ncbi:MAG: signal peptide peptidase SppA [Chloroflexia bacterium]
MSTGRQFPKWVWWIVVGLGLLGLLAGVCLWGTLFVLGEAGRGASFPGARQKIALVRVEGVIVSGRYSLNAIYSSVAPAQTIAEQLDAAARDPSVVAVILRINSPGGGVVPSDEIYRAVKRVRAAGKPVVASMGDMAASGGYYIAAGADYIVANPHTTTGSIGVIMTILNLEGLYEKLGVAQEVIKSSRFKDIGSPARPLTEEERAILQGLVDQAYEAFVRVVAEGRSLPIETVRELADGRIYSGQQALDKRLVDELGGIPEALEAARRLSGVPQARLVEPPTPSWLEIALGALRPVTAPEVREILGLDQPLSLQYLYSPEVR